MLLLDSLPLSLLAAVFIIGMILLIKFKEFVIDFNPFARSLIVSTYNAYLGSLLVISNWQDALTCCVLITVFAAVLLAIEKRISEKQETAKRNRRALFRAGLCIGSIQLLVLPHTLTYIAVVYCTGEVATLFSMNLDSPFLLLLAMTLSASVTLLIILAVYRDLRTNGKLDE